MISHSQWPVHEKNTVVSILAEVETETLRFLYREDGTIAVGFDPELLADGGEVPGYVSEAARQPGCTLIPREDRAALRRLLDKADEIEAS